MRPSVVLREDVTEPTFGNSFSGPIGAIARPGLGPYRHIFGGEAWSISNGRECVNGAIVLLTLDRKDPLLASVGSSRVKWIPLLTVVSLDIGLLRLAYRCDDRHMTVELLDELPADVPSIDFPFTWPLTESPLSLAPMAPNDYPISEETYWDASDRFVGGQDFIRVGGPPLWLYSVAHVFCNCGNEMTYACSVGYESIPPWSGLIPGYPVFFGEMAFYWFICAKCDTMAVISQST